MHNHPESDPVTLLLLFVVQLPVVYLNLQFTVPSKWPDPLGLFSLT